MTALDLKDVDLFCGVDESALRHDVDGTLVEDAPDSVAVDGRRRERRGR